MARPAAALSILQRPRDRYGRPLAVDADLADVTASVPDRDEISSSDAWTEALNYLDQDLPFHAHEVFEQRWRCCPPDERALWRALAQWGAAKTHQARNNSKGSREVATRAYELLTNAQLVAPVDRDLVLASLKTLMP